MVRAFVQGRRRRPAACADGCTDELFYRGTTACASGLCATSSSDGRARGEPRANCSSAGRACGLRHCGATSGEESCDVCERTLKQTFRVARTRAAQRSHAAPKRPTSDVLPRLRVNAGYHPLSALALQPVAVAAPVMGAPVAGPQFGTYAAVPMHHRPRNTSRRSTCARVCYTPLRLSARPSYCGGAMQTVRSP